MKKLFVLFLVMVAFLICSSSFGLADEKDDELVIAQYQAVSEKVLRIETQLGWIQQQTGYLNLHKDLEEAKKLKTDLEVKVKAIEVARKKAEADKKGIPSTPTPAPQKK